MSTFQNHLDQKMKPRASDKKGPPLTQSRMSCDCPVCALPFTSQLRKPVKCPYCEFAACVVCNKKYLTEGTLDAHCMSCRRAWNDEFLDLNFTRAFRIGPYKKHRETVLMDREKSLLPTRQTRVIAKIKVREVEVEMKKVYEKLAEWERERSRILRDSHRLSAQIARYTAESEGRAPPAWTLANGEGGATAAPATERAKFIMKCPADGCRGFLSTAYKCGTCQMWACPDCLVIKGKDKDAEHTCDPGQKESVAMIIKESRPCPKCGERISKIDGCDQMWCTECHTAFSWTTGQQVNGVVHNPHYYEFLRKQGNGVAPRNAGDVPCGGVPYYQHLYNAISRRVDAANQRTIMAIHRITAEIADQRIQQYQGHFNVEDNGDLGVRYLMNEMTEEQMKSELAKRELKRNKHLAIRAVLEMFVTTSTMMLNNIVSHPPASGTEVTNLLLEYENLRKYVNDSLLATSRMKSCSVPLISEGWAWKPFNKAPPRERPAKKTPADGGDDTSEDSTDAEDNEAGQEKKKKKEEALKKRREALKKAREARTAAPATPSAPAAPDAE